MTSHLRLLIVGHQVATGQNPRRFSDPRARREIREDLQLMQLGQSEPSLVKRSLSLPIDTYERKGPKTTRLGQKKER